MAKAATSSLPIGALLLLGTLAATSAAPSAAATWTVDAADGPRALADAVSGAAAGDEIVVEGGVHRGPLVIDKSLRLRGQGWPVIDGGGAGTVVAVRVPDVAVEGFVIRGSGKSLDQENSGVALDGADRSRVANNRLEDVLFGVYLRESPGSVVSDNRIRGKPLDLPRRGDAIRVWSSDGVTITGNSVKGSRDVVLWYSAGLTVRDNRITDGRYGLHFMYCDDAAIEGNLLVDNSVGAFLMYSRRLRLAGNAIAGNHGPSGYGVGLKDMDDAVVEDNLFAGNRVGAFLDNSPREMASTTRVAGNLFAANDVGVTLLPNVRRGAFLGNSFVENAQQVRIAGGGGDPEANRWRGNYWSDYAGYDADDDGRGDVPYRVEELFDQLADRRPELRLFQLSPATHFLDFAARAFPVVQPKPRLADPAPRMTPHRPQAPPSLGQRGDPRLWPVGGTLVACALLTLLSPGLAERRRRRATPTMPPTRESRESELRAAEATAPDEPATEEPAASEPLLSVRGLTKRFGEQTALEDVTFTVHRGESVALWGPNGAGKTTALRALLGVIPCEGELQVAGADPWRDGKAVRRHLGFVPQEIRFPDDLGVAETLSFYAQLRRVPQERAGELTALLGIEEEAEKQVGELSGGLRQRLALATALLSDPPILFLDEPTANLDARSRAAFLDLLRELRGRGKTLVFSSHRPEEVAALAGRVLHLDRGRLVADGPPSPELLGRRGDAELWLRVAESEHDRAAELLAGLGLEPRRLGPHLVVTIAAERKTEPLRTLWENGVEIEDFELETAAGHGAGEEDRR